MITSDGALLAGFVGPVPSPVARSALSAQRSVPIVAKCGVFLRVLVPLGAMRSRGVVVGSRENASQGVFPVGGKPEVIRVDALPVPARRAPLALPGKRRSVVAFMVNEFVTIKRAVKNLHHKAMGRLKFCKFSHDLPIPVTTGRAVGYETPFVIRDGLRKEVRHDA